MGVVERLGILLSALQFLAPVAGAREATGIYVTPYFDSNGSVIHVGKFSTGLASADRRQVEATVMRMKGEFHQLSVEAMYVAAIRLYEEDNRDAALYWFYSAQYRARLFRSLLKDEPIPRIGDEPFELVSAHSSFQQLAGEPINGYAGCSQQKWLATLDLVGREAEKLPDLEAIYPRIRFLPRGSWPEANKKERAGLQKLAKHVKANWSEMARIRAENGTDAKYCSGGRRRGP